MPATATFIPILLFDERDPQEIENVLAAGSEILDECIACGGSVTGEHGIGVEKISFMHKLFTPADLDAMSRLRAGLQSRRPAQPGQDASHRRRLRPGAKTPRPPSGDCTTP